MVGRSVERRRLGYAAADGGQDGRAAPGENTLDRGEELLLSPCLLLGLKRILCLQFIHRQMISCKWSAQAFSVRYETESLLHSFSLHPDSVPEDIMLHAQI